MELKSCLLVELVCRSDLQLKFSLGFKIMKSSTSGIACKAKMLFTRIIETKICKKAFFFLSSQVLKSKFAFSLLEFQSQRSLEQSIRAACNNWGVPKKLHSLLHFLRNFAKKSWKLPAEDSQQKKCFRKCTA